MILRPPRSTRTDPRLPYTTLCRSEFYKAATSGDLETARRIQAEMAAMLSSFFGLGTFPASVKASLDLIGRPGGRTRDPIRPLTPEQDRKSTRLNSSH